MANETGQKLNDEEHLDLGTLQVNVRLNEWRHEHRSPKEMCRERNFRSAQEC